MRLGLIEDLQRAIVVVDREIGHARFAVDLRHVTLAVDQRVAQRGSRFVAISGHVVLRAA